MLKGTEVEGGGAVWLRPSSAFLKRDSNSHTYSWARSERPRATGP